MVAIILGSADTVANLIAQHPIYSSRIWRPASGSRSGLDGLLSDGPTLLVVESGALWVRIAYGGRIVRADGQVETARRRDGASGTVLEAVLYKATG